MTPAIVFTTARCASLFVVVRETFQESPDPGIFVLGAVAMGLLMLSEPVVKPTHLDEVNLVYESHWISNDLVETDWEEFERDIAAVIGHKEDTCMHSSDSMEDVGQPIQDTRPSLRLYDWGTETRHQVISKIKSSHVT